MPEIIGDTYLRTSLFHPGRDHWLTFVVSSTIRYFHYLFAQGAIGVLGLFFFLAGIWLLLSGAKGLPINLKSAGPRTVGVLLLSPFVVNCGLALMGIYPYGGTRHNSILSGFALSGVAIGLTCWRVAGRWLNPGIVVVLAICNLFPAPTGPYIQPRNQTRGLMHDAIEFVRNSIPQNSMIVTDNGGGLLLTYYLCDQDHYQPTVRTFVTLQCADHRIITPEPQFQDRLLASLQSPAAEMYGLSPGVEVWMFEAGWITAGRKHDAQQEIRRLKCASPRQFGSNILVCKTVLGDKGEN